jgi:hypothetical protein
MAKTSKELSDQFRKEMRIFIDFWKEEENKLYTNSTTLTGNQQDDELRKIFIKEGQAQFPQTLFRAWMRIKRGEGTKEEALTLQAISKYVETEGAQIQKDTGQSISISKGVAWEKLGATLLNRDDALIQKVANALQLTLEHTGTKNYREDMSLTEDYTLDFKWSDKTGDERFLNIVKTHGAESYTSITEIENNIMASMYTFGASNGIARYNPNLTNTGLFKRPKTADGLKGFEEEEQYRGGRDLDNLSHARKILIFFFKEGGYWASYCLEKVVDWAANRLIEMEYKNLVRSKGEKFQEKEPGKHIKAFWGWEENSLDYLKTQPIYGGYDKKIP